MKKLLSAMFLVAVASTSFAQAQVAKTKKKLNLVEVNSNEALKQEELKKQNVWKMKKLAETQSRKKILSYDEKLRKEEKEASNNK